MTGTMENAGMDIRVGYSAPTVEGVILPSHNFTTGALYFI